jgi:hypothetical protein
MPARLLLLCLQRRAAVVGAATVLHHRGGRGAVAVSGSVAGGVSNQQCWTADPVGRDCRK